MRVLSLPHGSDCPASEVVPRVVWETGPIWRPTSVGRAASKRWSVVAGGALRVEVEAALDHSHCASGRPVQASDRTRHTRIGNPSISGDDLLVQHAECPRQIPMGYGATSTPDDVCDVGAQDRERTCLPNDVAVLRRPQGSLHFRTWYACRGGQVSQLLLPLILRARRGRLYKLA